MRIAEYARCPELKEAIEMNHVLIYNWFFDLAAGRRKLPKGFHGLLVKAITAKDALAADQAMRQHVQYGVQETLQRMVPQPKSDWRLRRLSPEQAKATAKRLRAVESYRTE
jgi:DNA-binding GntR family transcriptional regulator